MSAVEAFNRALALRANGQAAEAIQALQEAVRLDPKLGEAHHQLGNMLRREGRMREALEHLEIAARFQPGNALTFLNLGVTYLDLEQAAAAVVAIEHAFPAAAKTPEAQNLLGCALLAAGRLSDAREHLEIALQLRPGYAAAHDNLGRVCRAQGRMEQALAHFQTALQSAPSAATHSNALLAANYLPGLPIADITEFHREWGRRYAPAAAAHSASSPGEGRRLRVGYVSPDFRQHSVSFFFEPVLTHHNRAQFEIYCYYNHANRDETTERLQGLAEHWREIASLSDEQVAEGIRRDGIDILIDLAGHTAGNRLLVFARKPAPIQISWLGYPNTTGLAAMDYRVTDAACLPAGIDEQAFGSEKLLRLPEVFCCYQPNANSPPVVAEAEGEEVRPFTYCSFNHLAKISAPTIAAWSQILRQHPGSRLLIKSPGARDSDTQSYFREQFAKCEIAADRVDFHGEALPLREHLRLYHGCDIALDPFPYNGTTTTCEALLMGVPVVTLAGEAHVSRVGVSFLQSVRLADLVAKNVAQYCDIAARLAADAARRKELRATLRERLLSSPLGQPEAFTRKFEAALREVSQLAKVS